MQMNIVYRFEDEHRLAYLFPRRFWNELQSVEAIFFAAAANGSNSKKGYPHVVVDAHFFFDSQADGPVRGVYAIAKRTLSKATVRSVC